MSTFTITLVRDIIIKKIFEMQEESHYIDLAKLDLESIKNELLSDDLISLELKYTIESNYDAYMRTLSSEGLFYIFEKGTIFVNKRIMRHLGFGYNSETTL